MHRGWGCEMRLNSKQQITVKGGVKERARAVGPSQARIGRNQTTAPTGFGHGLPASSISRVGEMAGQVKTPATKSDNLILIPGTHIVEKRIDFYQVSSTLHVCLASPSASKEVDVGDLSNHLKSCR